MSHQSEPEPSNFSYFTILFERALEEYEGHTGEPWTKHPLASQLEQSYSVESVERVLQEQAQALTQSGGSDSKIVKSLKSAIPILYQLSTNTTLRDAISVPFPIAKPIFISFAVLLGAAKDVNASHNALANLLELIGQSIDRLGIYTQVTLERAMVEFIVKMMVQLLHVLGLVTKEIKQNRLTKFVKKVFGKNDIEVALQKLKEVTLIEEGPITTAQVLKNTDALVKGGKEMREMLQQIASDMNQSKRDKLAADLRSWLSPPDPGKNQDEHFKLRRSGTASWFLNDETYSKWKSSEQSSLLWIHGKPGAGKSVLCSEIIQNIEDMRKSQPAILTFYYCDYKEEQKRDLRGLLSSLLVQLCRQSDSYCDILFKFFKDYTNGSQHANDAALVLCLKNILGHPRQHPVYLIVDALDECPNPPVRLPPRKEVLQLLEELVKSNPLPNLHICVTSRPEPDIKLVLNRLTSYAIPLHDEEQQIHEINGYITWFVHHDERIMMQGWSREVKQHVIAVLTKKANGMFRWVDCQLPYLRGCLPRDIQKVLDGLPDTLNGTYERVLREIIPTLRESAHQLFQVIAVASRPFTVKELAEVFAFDFSPPVPKFCEDWRLTNPVHAVLSACSSLLTIVDIYDAQLIQFSHFSVEEFLTSDHLSKANDISYFHISTTPAHTLVTRVCLGILLHLPKAVTRDDLEKYPLAEYAAVYWVDHARFEDESRQAEDGMKELFDPREPHHLAVWIWIHDHTRTYRSWRDRLEQAKTPSKPSKTALHYAAFHGLFRIAEYLIAQDVDAHDFGEKCTALYVALARGHIEVARVLVGAVTTGKVGDGEHAEVTQARALLEHSAVATAQNGWTPLHFASDRGYFELALVLVEHGIDLTAVTAQNENGWTPLHFASDRGHLEVARVLLEHRADPAAQNENGWTPLHFALDRGHLELAWFLLEHGADPAAQNENGWTPLHFALDRGYLELARVLLERGADPTAKENGSTPLHFASDKGHLELARVILERGADPRAQNRNGWTPLHFASDRGHLEFAQFLLLKCGADPRAQNRNGWTPLHFALDRGHLELVRVLLEHLERIAQNEDGWTLLHFESNWGNLELVRVLLKCGADPTAQNEDGSTPLHFASDRGHLELAQVLLEYGAVATAQDGKGQTPVSLALSKGHTDLVQVLREHSAVAMAQETD